MVREKSTSIQYINVLRIITTYIVVTGHIAIWSSYTAPPLGVDWWILKWVHLVGLWVIPAFVMISGTLLLNNPRGESAMAFYKRRMYRIGVPVIFWSALYLVIRVVVDKEEMTVLRAAELVFRADPYYHLWYVWMIPALYLVTPPLRVFVKHSTSAQRILLIAIIFLLAGIYSPINNLYLGNKRTIFTMFIPYIAYYMTGYEIVRADPKKIPFKYLLIAVAICAGYITLMAYPFIDRLGSSKTIFNFLYDGFSPPQVALGIGIFWAVYLIGQRAKPLKGIPKTAVEWMASTTLGIYMMHPLMLAFMRYKFSDESADEGLLFTLTVGPLVAFIACYLASSLILNIPYLKRTIS
ncbi:MAG: acyltransferase family protein [Phycisphaerae bacterium]|nr:acyltransferase family protein [Phycisphaerae bacterium]